MKQQQTKRWLCVRWRWWKRRRRRRWRLRERSTVNIHHHCCVSSVLILEFYMSIYILWSIHENNKNVVYSTIFDIGLHFIKIQVLHQKQQTNEIHLLLERRELNEYLSPSSWSTSNNLIISVLNLYDKSCLNIVYIFSSAFAIGKFALPKSPQFCATFDNTHTTAPTN